MVYGLWQSVGGLQAQDYRQTVLANNLANADTPGFKPDRVSFIERMNATLARGTMATRNPTLDGMTGGVFESPTYTDYSQGGLVPSDNRLDIALQGDGFLQVKTSEGIRVTRDGRLTMAKDGTLKHAASGGEVVDGQGRPIVVDPSRKEDIKIDTSGNVKQGDIPLGKLALVDFSDHQTLEKAGQNLLSSDKAQPTTAKCDVEQGFQEISGVEPVMALTEMISASRAYQLNATMITMQDESLGRVVNELGKIG